jgi:hypothetical protein
VEEAQSYLDVITPEMLARGDYAAEKRGRRYYRLSHLDRLRRNEKLTYEQHQAGVWYRAQWDAGQYDKPRTSDYTRVRGENVVQFTLPTNAQQARNNWRTARSAIPGHLVGLADRLILRNEWPKVHHRTLARSLADLRDALDSLARHLRLY